MSSSQLIGKSYRGAKLLLKSPINLIKRNLYINDFKPELVVFSLTDRCQSRCSHCNIWKIRDYRKEMTPEEIGRIFSDSFFSEMKSIIVSGGEITLRHDLKNVLWNINNAMPGISICVSTNGLLPDRMIDTVKYCMEHGLNLVVGISLDGVGEKHDNVRGMPGNFKKVDYLVDELVKIRDEYPRLNIILGITHSESTHDSVDETKAYAMGKGVDFVPQIAEEGAFYRNYGDIKNTSNEKMLKVLSTLKDSSHVDFAIRFFMGDPVKFKCFALNKFFVLQANGDISPCLRYSNIFVGNLRTQSPAEIYTTEKMIKAKRMVKNCKGCLNTWVWDLSVNSYDPSLLN